MASCMSRAASPPLMSPAPSSTGAFGINPRGDIVGQDTAGGITHGFLLHEGTFATIMSLAPPPQGPSGSPSLKGDIIGQDSAGGGTTHGFLLDKKEGSFTTIDVPGATSTQPMGINAWG